MTDVPTFYETHPILTDLPVGTVLVSIANGKRWGITSLCDGDGNGAEIKRLDAVGTVRLISFDSVYDKFKRELTDDDLNNIPATSLWSSCGHRFTSDGGGGNDPDHPWYAWDETCMSCGATYEAYRDDPDDPSHYDYRTWNGDKPSLCPGEHRAHGGAPCADLSCTQGQQGPCKHTEHDCNCRSCTA